MPDQEHKPRRALSLRAGQGLGPPRSRRQRGSVGPTEPPPSWENPSEVSREQPPLDLPALGRAFLRPSRTQLVIAVILMLFATGAVIQYRTKNSADLLTNARREDLVQILDNANAESKRLESEIAALQRTKEQLESGADSARVAQEEAAKRLAAAQIMAGTVGAQGRGITITIYDANQSVTAGILLDAIEELRDAGAEVIALNGTVRIVAASWFSSNGAALIADGQEITRPIRIDVIGDPQALEEACRFRGGLISQVENPSIGGTVSISRPTRVIITALHTPTKDQYAKPA